MHNSEAERVRDVVLLWHMVFGNGWISGSRMDLEMPWEKLKLISDTLGEHQYLEYKVAHGVKTQARLNNKALKLIGAQQNDTQD
jgi:hypothetical protein